MKTTDMLSLIAFENETDTHPEFQLVLARDMQFILDLHWSGYNTYKEITASVTARRLSDRRTILQHHFAHRVLIDSPWTNGSAKNCTPGEWLHELKESISRDAVVKISVAKPLVYKMQLKLCLSEYSVYEATVQFPWEKFKHFIQD